MVNIRDNYYQSIRFCLILKSIENLFAYFLAEPKQAATFYKQDFLSKLPETENDFLMGGAQKVSMDEEKIAGIVDATRQFKEIATTLHIAEEDQKVKNALEVLKNELDALEKLLPV